MSKFWVRNGIIYGNPHYGSVASDLVWRRVSHARPDRSLRQPQWIGRNYCRQILRRKRGTRGVLSLRTTTRKWTRSEAFPRHSGHADSTNIRLLQGPADER